MTVITFSTRAIGDNVCAEGKFLFESFHQGAGFAQRQRNSAFDVAIIKKTPGPGINENSSPTVVNFLGRLRRIDFKFMKYRIVFGLCVYNPSAWVPLPHKGNAVW